MKIVFLEISQNLQESTCGRVSFLIKLQASGKFVKKETLAQVFSCEFCEPSKNTFFSRTPLVSDSGNRLMCQRYLTSTFKQFSNYTVFIQAD